MLAACRANELAMGPAVLGVSSLQPWTAPAEKLGAVKRFAAHTRTPVRISSNSCPIPRYAPLLFFRSAGGSLDSPHDVHSPQVEFYEVPSRRGRVRIRALSLLLAQCLRCNYCLFHDCKCNVVYDKPSSDGTLVGGWRHHKGQSAHAHHLPSRSFLLDECAFHPVSFLPKGMQHCISVYFIH